jgi:hypothetical protein
VVVVGGLGLLIGSNLSKSASSNKAPAAAATNGAAVSTTLRSTTTTTGRATTTTTLSASAALLGPSPTPEVTQAFAVATELAAALASGDWARARQLEPAKAKLSDDQLAGPNGYLGLNASIPVLVRADGTGPVRLRLGLVADETRSTGEQTSLYCATWTVDLSNDQVTEEPGTTTAGVAPAGVDPLTVVDELRASC